MYIRFVIAQRNPDSHRCEGLFQGLSWIKDQYDLTPGDLAEIEDCLAWFSNHLRRPKRLARSARSRACPRAVCWFKPTAHRHLRQMHRLAAVFRRVGAPVFMVTTRRPGYIVYQDEFQIVAEPFRDTRT